MPDLILRSHWQIVRLTNCDKWTDSQCTLFDGPEWWKLKSLLEWLSVVFISLKMIIVELKSGILFSADSYHWNHHRFPFLISPINILQNYGPSDSSLFSFILVQRDYLSILALFWREMISWFWQIFNRKCFWRSVFV